MSDTPQSQTVPESIRQAAKAVGKAVGEISNDPQYPAILERRLKALENNSQPGGAGPEPGVAVAVARGLSFLREHQTDLAAAPQDAVARAKSLIRKRLEAIRQQKEAVLGEVLRQTKPLETTWRGLQLAYQNSLNAEGQEARFYLVSASKDTLLKEATIAPTVGGTDQRRKQSLIETLLRDRADRPGGTPFSLVILPFQIEAEDVDFFRRLGKLGRKYRSPVLGGLGPSLLRRETVPLSGDDIVGSLKAPVNQDWKKLIAADNQEDAEALTYLALVVPRIAGRLPYRFQEDLPEFRADNALYREGVLWLPAAYAFAGKVDNLGGRSVHLMPAGKSFGRVEVDLSIKAEKDRYKTIPREKAPRHFPLEADLYISNADELWEQGLITLMRWDDTGTVNFYGDPTLLASPERLAEGEPMTSLGVRLTNDHILHYCNRYLYSKIGEPVTDDLAHEVESTLQRFLNRNAGNALDRPLKDGGFEVKAWVNPEKEGELLVDIQIEVKQSLRKVQVRMKVKRGEGIEEVR